MLKVYLTAIDEPLTQAWEKFCSNIPNVTVFNGSILDLNVDAVVSPANSFGFMDGGIDAVYTRRFGKQLQNRLQQLIRTKHDGELLVGNAELIETLDSSIPYLIAAPTMRVPMILKESVNPYLAARAALLLVTRGIFSEGKHAGKRIAEVIQSVAFPGLGTGVGRVGPNTCAHQVHQAIMDTLFDQPKFPHTWAEAQQRHQLLYTDRIRNLQNE